MTSFTAAHGCPILPMEMAEAILVTSIRSIRCIRHSDVATEHLPYLNVAPRSVIPEVVKAAIARQVYVNLDCFSACGQVSLLSLAWRMAQEPEYSELLLISSAKAVDVASMNGRISVLQWWVSHMDPEIPLTYSENALDGASEQGHLAVLKWWKTDSGLPLKYTVLALQNAAKNGHVDVLDWWLQLGPLDPKGYYTDLDGFLDQVGLTGNIAALQWWLAHRDEVAQHWTDKPYTSSLINTALTSGNVGILRWLMTNVDKRVANHVTSDCVNEAIDSKQQASLNWLAEQKVYVGQNLEGVERAVLHQKNKVLGQWLLDSGLSQVSHYGFLHAVKTADVDYIDWYFSRLDAATLQHLRGKDKVRMFWYASAAGSVELLDWMGLRMNTDPSQLGHVVLDGEDVAGRQCYEIGDCMLLAAQNGHVAVLQWFDDNEYVWLDPQLAMDCVHIATCHGKPQVLDWISCDTSRSNMDVWAHDFAGVTGMTVSQILESFDCNDAEQYVGVLQWYWDHFPSLFADKFIRDQTARVFNRSATLLDWWAKVVEPVYPMTRTGDLDDMDDANVLHFWLTKRYYFGYSSDAMDHASANGRVDLLDCWLHYSKSEVAKRQGEEAALPYTRAAMENASRNGHLEVLEWWMRSGIRPLKYSRRRALKFNLRVDMKRQAEIVRWWLASGLP